MGDSRREGAEGRELFRMGQVLVEVPLVLDQAPDQLRGSAAEKFRARGLVSFD